MRILVDTNVLIPLEPTSPEYQEDQTRSAAEFVGLCQGRHALVVHPESLAELESDPDPGRRELRAALIEKYERLPRPPDPDASMVEQLGTPQPGTNDWVDHQLLAAVARDAVDLLITEDQGIHRKARSLSLSERVVGVRDAIVLIRNLLGTIPTPPPFVTPVPAHALDERDPIFESFRGDYEGFDQWLAKAKRGNRQSWIVEQPGADGYAGVCIIKDDDDEYGLGGRVVKISSLKVAEEFQGNRYGELLLKTIFGYCSENRVDHVWVTVFPKHEGLIALLTDFGFERQRQQTRLEELVFAKRFTIGPGDDDLDALTLHVRRGPPAIRLAGGDAYAVPIQPVYHKMLFPEYEDQVELVPRAFGNALRKAYLSRGSIRRLGPGSSLFFYRSGDVQALTCVGVVESTMVSGDADEVARFVGQRTVYSFDQIAQMCDREVLAILFRQDRFIEPPIGLATLQESGVFKRAPQSIMTLSEEAVSWLEERIGA